MSWSRILAADPKKLTYALMQVRETHKNNIQTTLKEYTEKEEEAK